MQHAQHDHITPNASPNMIRWNIGRVGSPRVGACIDHVEFMLFVSISFVLGSQHEHSFWWNMGLTVKVEERKKQTMSSNSLASYRGKKLLSVYLEEKKVSSCISLA